MEKIKVSIIIPVYNNSKYLRDCLNSVLKQTLDNIEIIAIDDYSTDDSFTILKEYQSKYQEKIKIIRNNKNMGVGYTRNLGISMSTGKYIGFIDGDDYINPRMYEDMYNNGEKNNADIVSTGILFVKDSKYLDNDLNFMGRSKGYIYNTKIDFERLSNLSPSSCNKIYKRDILNKIRFVEDSMWEDVAFTYSALFNSNRVLVMNNWDYFYRKSSLGISFRNYDYNENIYDCFKIVDSLVINTKFSNNYLEYKYYIDFIIVCFILQRACEVLNWNVLEDTKIEVINTLNNTLITKYGINYQDYDKTLLSTKVGIIELDKINSYINNKSLK